MRSPQRSNGRGNPLGANRPGLPDESSAAYSSQDHFEPNAIVATQPRRRRQASLPSTAMNANIGTISAQSRWESAFFRIIAICSPNADQRNPANVTAAPPCSDSLPVLREQRPLGPTERTQAEPAAVKARRHDAWASPTVGACVQGNERAWHALSHHHQKMCPIGPREGAMDADF